MTRRWFLALIAANLIGLTALVFVYPQFMVAPGPLMPAHESLETDCFACHVPLRGAVAERCITCHQVDDIGLRTTAGVPIDRATAIPPFHQGLMTRDCMACHSDHTKPALTRPKMASFSHALLNAATRYNCLSCHVAPATAVHSDPTAKCTQCHTQDSWKSATFDHTAFFPLEGSHNATCATCHTTSEKKQYTCYGCHEHSEDDTRARHMREGIVNITNCVLCHKSAHGEGRDEKRGGDDD